jgi:hypothetical protein
VTLWRADARARGACDRSGGGQWSGRARGYRAQGAARRGRQTLSRRSLAEPARFCLRDRCGETIVLRSLLKTAAPLNDTTDVLLTSGMGDRHGSSRSTTPALLFVAVQGVCYCSRVLLGSIYNSLRQH